MINEKANLKEAEWHGHGHGAVLSRAGVRGPPTHFLSLPAHSELSAGVCEWKFYPNRASPKAQFVRAPVSINGSDLNIPFLERHFAGSELSALPGSSMTCVRISKQVGKGMGGVEREIKWGLLQLLKLNCAGGWFWREVHQKGCWFSGGLWLLTGG